MTSGHFLERRYNLTEEEENDEDVELYYYDPITNTTNITDLIFPETLNYTIA